MWSHLSSTVPIAIYRHSSQCAKCCGKWHCTDANENFSPSSSLLVRIMCKVCMQTASISFIYAMKCAIVTHCDSPWIPQRVIFMMTSSNGNIFRATGHLCGEFTGELRGIHRSPVNSPHKGQWRGAFVFLLICVGINDWINNLEAGDLRRHLGHYDVNVMFICPYLGIVFAKSFFVSFLSVRLPLFV